MKTTIALLLALSLIAIAGTGSAQPGQGDDDPQLKKIFVVYNV